MPPAANGLSRRNYGGWGRRCPGPAVSPGEQVTLVLTHYDDGRSVRETIYYSARRASTWRSGSTPASTAMRTWQLSRPTSTRRPCHPDRTASPPRTRWRIPGPAIATYFQNCESAEPTIDGLTGAVPVFSQVASGIATGSTPVTFDSSLQNPAIPQNINVDVQNTFHLEFTGNGNTANNTMRQELLGDDGSARRATFGNRSPIPPGSPRSSRSSWPISSLLPSVTVTSDNQIPPIRN